MALRMVGLVRAKGGAFIARKSIPVDVRDEFEIGAGGSAKSGSSVAGEAHLGRPWVAS